MTSLGDYTILTTLGSGAFSKVKLAEHTKTGEKCAIKIMKKEKAKKSGNLKLYKNEVKALNGVNHPNILRLIEYSESTPMKKRDGKMYPCIYVALEFAENGEMFDYISDSGRFSEPVCRFYFRQLLDALEFMNNRGFSHRDIKPENILLDGCFNLKLGDWGFATKQRVSSSRKGTSGYMAPEVLAGYEYDSHISDIFSAGTVLFIMYTQFCPFINANKSDRFYSKIMGENWDSLWAMYENSSSYDLTFSDEFKDLFQKLICFDPTERATIDEIRRHEWMNGPMATSEEILEEFSRRVLVKNNAKNGKKNSSKSEAKTEETEANKPVLPSPAAAYAKEDKRYTKFFTVSDPDELVNCVVDFAMNNEYNFEKSDEYYRVEMEVCEVGEIAKIIANVLKKPDEESRCIQFLRSDGSRQAFWACFGKLKQYLLDRADLD